MRRLWGFEGPSAVECLKGNKTELCEASKGNLVLTQGSGRAPEA